jgi:molybdate transport system substrate-binding protein
MTVRSSIIVALAVAAAALAIPAQAAELKVLTTGAMKPVVLAAANDFQKQTGHTLAVENDTAGGIAKRIEGGAVFDVAINSPAIVDDLIAKGKIAAGTRLNIARVGVGVMVKAGAPKPDISSVDAFKKTLLAAKSVGYIDPASGGSSGIYLEKLFERLGIADAIKAKAKLKQGGYVADIVSNGEAEIGIHQISEILPATGVTLIGPLPAEIQNYTIYAGGVSAGAKEAGGAAALIKFLNGSEMSEVLRTKGMERPAS